MSKLFELITEFVEITGNSTVDSILLWVIGIISFLFAFGVVGIIFDTIGIYDSDVMSDCHWIIRILVFLGLSFVCISIFKFLTWLFSFQWWVYLFLLVVLISALVLIHFIKHKYNKNKFKEIIENKEIDSSKEINISTIKTRNICPRCGGDLVKRHGPYGDFYGCGNFSTKGCRYTRRFI